MAEQDIKEICQSCKYFVTSNAVLGVCKRFPHYVNKHDADWCGEHTLKAVVENFAQLQKGGIALCNAAPELAEAAEGLVNLSVEPKKRGRKPKNAETPYSS